MTREAFLRRAGVAAVGLSIPGLLAACGDDGSTATEGISIDEATGKVNYLGWQGYDYKRAAKPLTSSGVTLSPTYITTGDDVVTKLRGGAGGNIDVVGLGSTWLEALAGGGFIQEIDYSELPSSSGYFPEFTEIIGGYADGAIYAAPIVWGDIPIIYRPDMMPDLPESWLDLRDPKYKGKLITLDDTYMSMTIFSRAVNGPKDAEKMTQAQLDDVIAVWKEIMPNVVTVAPSYGDASDAIARGDAAAMITGWRFQQQLMKDKGIASKAHTPKEGTIHWLDTYSVPTEAPNVDAAYAFMNTMTSPEGNALMAEFTGSGAVNQESVSRLAPDQRNLYPYDEIKSYVSVTKGGFYPLPLEPDGDYVSYDAWLKAWEEIKGA